MSTILDALRKLQRQRELAKPPQDLQESVTQQISQARPPRRLRSLFVGFGLFALLLGVVGGALIWKPPPMTPEEALNAAAKRAWEERFTVKRPPAARRASPRPPPATPSRQPLADAATLAPSPIPAASEPAVRPGPRAESLQPRVDRRVSSAELARKSTRVGPSASAPSPAAAKPTPPPGQAAAQKRAKLAAAKSRVSGRRQREPLGSAQEASAVSVTAPKPPPAASTVPARGTRKASVEIKPPPNAKLKPPPESTPTTQLKSLTPSPQVAKLAEPERRRQPEPSRQESNPFLEPFEPVTRVERSPSVTRDAQKPPPALAVPDFPELALESVRWHPDPSRRVANVVLGRARGVTVREGDIVRGALIYRIDPGTLELRVGTAKKLLQMGP